MKKIIGLFLLSILIIVITQPSIFSANQNKEKLTNHDLYDNYQTPDEINIITYEEINEELNNGISNTGLDVLIGNKKIMISTSNDLYNFSQDLSYVNEVSHQVKVNLASKSFILGNDIDYSIMKSRRFMPIGYVVDSEELSFTGKFDGRGFEIKGLYFENFQKFSYDDLDHQNYVYSSYFSMFTKNDGTITNFGLINPIVDLENEHHNLTGFSYVVGLNNNLVENVYVEDNRSIYNGGGMRAVATKVIESLTKTAAGIVNNNSSSGVIKDVYFTGEAVVGLDFINAFQIEPVVYYNYGELTSGVYDNTEYLLNVLIGNNNVTVKTPTNGVGNSTNILKNGSTNLSSDVWYYYKDDGYPKLWGLDKDSSNNLLIESAIDLFIFTKLLKLISTNGTKRYSESNYLLMNHINMSELSTGAYKTPDVEFSGSLKGRVVNDIYPQINNLSITRGVNKGSDYYIGLFSVLSGSFENIVLYNIDVTLKNQENFYGQQFNIGPVTGELKNGNINNVSVTGNIDLSKSKVGSFNLGGLVGKANGNITGVLNDLTTMFVGNQNYLNTNYINGDFNFGGIAGSTSGGKLNIYNAKNKANLETISNNIYQETARHINNRIGGIIGFNTNTNIYKSEFGLLTNEGNLKVNSVNLNRGSITSYLGGIIGESTGFDFDFTNRFGDWSNLGHLDKTGTITNTTYVAGILNSTHSNASNLEFVQLYTEQDLVIANEYVYATNLVNHLGSSNLTLSQGYSTGTINLLIGKDVEALVRVVNPNVNLQLNFIESNIDIIIDNISLTKNLSVVGVTLHEKTNYLNVIYSGNLNNISNNINAGNHELWVAGLGKTLASGHYIKNSINEGSIILNVSNTSKNIYIAGLINRNLSGDLHNQDNSSRPVANTGIINSINRADISVTVNLTGTVLVGGITTMNGGPSGSTIQDVVNSGNINIVNNNESTSINFGNASTGGVVTSYVGGIFIGGITAVVTHETSRIFDTSNKGDIFGLAKVFVRTGGVLGSVLWQELKAAKLDDYLFYTNNTQASVQIRNSVLSNGINYGNITSLASIIPVYNSQGRPGMYAVSGGVIGYGLSKMVRMINHGKISSTDVAGGIVGATTLYNGTNATNIRRQSVTVDINTALNYGDIRAIRVGSFITVRSSRVVVETNYYPDNDTFIFPVGTDSSDNPGSKRGFGGIIGRIQRGQYYIMSDQNGSFDLIINMNENVDLIGRLDQFNVSTSGEFFKINGRQYYSARKNDSTQAVFTGYYRQGYTKGLYIKNNSNSNIVVTRSGSTNNNNITTFTYQFPNGFDGEVYEIVNGNTFTGGQANNVFEDRYIRRYPDNSRRVTIQLSGTPTDNTIRNILNATLNLNVSSNNHLENYFIANNTNYESTSLITISTAIGVNHITENPFLETDLSIPYPTQFVYSNDFALRSQSELQEYIYYAERNLLANRFYGTRTNGMYVLSSSSGSTYGSVLPKNFKVNQLRKLDYNVGNKLDYNNLDNSDYREISINEDDYYNKLLEDYYSLYQTKLNDKSELLVDNQRVEILDSSDNEIYSVFEDTNFTSDKRTLTFDVDLTMLGDNKVIDFSIISALLPENAIIARTTTQSDDLQTFINQIKSDFESGYIQATGNNKPNLTFDLTNVTSGQVLSQEFVVYSEASFNDINLFNYQTSYELVINIKNNNTNPILNGYRLDNNQAYINIPIEPTIIVNNSVTFRFNDSSNKLPNGYDITRNLNLYYVDSNNTLHLVEEDYYTISSTTKINNQFTATISLSKELRNGQYQLSYKYFHNDSEKIITINYERVRNYSIYNFTPYNGLNYSNSNGNITVEIPFGSKLLDNYGGEIDRTVNSLPPYLNNKISSPSFLQYFSTSEFFDIASNGVYVEGLVDSEGYKYYNITITLEDGTIISNIVIKEAKLNPEFFKEGNRLTSINESNTVKAIDNATREAAETTFSLNYSNLVNDFYNINNFNFIITSNNIILDEEVILNYFNIGSTNQLNIGITENAIPGIYYIEVFYIKDGVNLKAGILEVKKLEGVSAYLTNIEFSEFIVGIEYPRIEALDSNMNVLTNYQPGVFIGGIDYDNSEINNVTNYKIYGQVSGTPLYNYLPHNIMNYLPRGSKIQRRLYNQTSEWTNSYTVDSSDISELYADFTIDPITGEFTEDDIFIQYRIISEDNLSSVDYYINVTDIKYNFTAVFNITYNGVPIDQVAKFNNQLILITMNNYLTDNEEGQTIPSDNPNDYPLYSSLEERLSTVTMFYHVSDNSPYSYNFGSNLSGYYQIEVGLPKEYNYQIKVNGVNESYYLNDFMTNGYYFYIMSSARMRTKYFTIEISDNNNPNDNWGLTDEENPWQK